MSRADRERQMLDVAEEIFAEQGYRAVSMDEIAERCGVSKPLIYEYFGSKDGLFLACVARCRAELYEATRTAMGQGHDPREVLWLGLVAYYEFTNVHHRSLALLLQEPMALPDATMEAVESVRRQQHDLIAPILATFAPDRGLHRDHHRCLRADLAVVYPQARHHSRGRGTAHARLLLARPGEAAHAFLSRARAPA
jgi:AcrR family transcriptional regulator